MEETVSKVLSAVPLENKSDVMNLLVDLLISEERRNKLIYSYLEGTVATFPGVRLSLHLQPNKTYKVILEDDNGRQEWNNVPLSFRISVLEWAEEKEYNREKLIELITHCNTDSQFEHIVSSSIDCSTGDGSISTTSMEDHFESLKKFFLEHLPGAPGEINKTQLNETLQEAVQQTSGVEKDLCRLAIAASGDALGIEREIERGIESTTNNNEQKE